MKNSLKIIFSLLIMSILGVSCMNDDDNNTYIQSLKGIAIDSVKIPQDTMSVYSIQTIKTYSTYASHCEGLYDYDYKIDGDLRTVTAIAYVTNGICTAQTYVGNDSFNFKPLHIGTYTFKFWNGEDSEGNDLYITKNVVVEE